MTWEPPRTEDVVGGRPDDIARLARSYAETARAITTAVRALEDIHHSGTTWEGEAGREFKVRTRQTASTIRRAEARYAATGEALRTYATALDQIQGDADSARRAYFTEGADDEARDAYEKRMAPIERSWEGAGNRAASAIEEVCKEDGLKDSWKDNFWGGLKQFTKLMGKLAAVLGVLALIFCWVPGLGQLLAGLALLASVLSLLGNLTLLAGGRGSLSDVLWDLASVLSFGAGRAFTMAGRSMVTAARGMAKPAMIASLRAGGMSFRQARNGARAMGITGGGREAKTLARAFKNGDIGWFPKPGQFVKGMFSNPFHGLSAAGRGDLPAAVRELPGLQVALRQMDIANRVSIGIGAGSNVKDLNDLASPHIPDTVPLVGGQSALDR